MKVILVVASLLLSLSVFSQSNKLYVSSSEIVVGKNLTDGSDIKGIKYVFPDYIYKTFLDTTTKLLTVQVRGVRKNNKQFKTDGNIIQYDLNSKSILWNKPISYITSSIQQFSKTTIHTMGGKSYSLDINTGESLWEVKNNVIPYVDPVNLIGFGYKNTLSGPRKELEGFDLMSGSMKWKRELNNDYGWNNVLRLNDSTLIVVAAGLHAININTGKGWDYHTVTGQKDYSAATALSIGGVALGLLTGVGFTSTGYDLISDIVSNTIADDSSIYLASLEQLARVDVQTGDVIWAQPFPEDWASNSTIFIRDSLVYMVNNGFAYMKNKPLSFGKPFFAAFDRQTGERKFFSVMNIEDAHILDFILKNNELYLLLKDRIIKYSLETGDFIAERQFSERSYGELKYFTGRGVFIDDKNDGFISLAKSDSTKVFAYTNQQKTLAVNSALKVEYVTEYKDLGIYNLYANGFTFIIKDMQTLILDSDGKVAAKITAVPGASIFDGVLYDQQDNHIIAIDLNSILYGNQLKE